MVAKKRIPAPKKKSVKKSPKAKVHTTLRGQESVKFVLRLHPKIHRNIKAEAAKNFQSMNEYIQSKMTEAIDPKNSLAYLIKELKKKGVI